MSVREMSRPATAIYALLSLLGLTVIALVISPVTALAAEEPHPVEIRAYQKDFGVSAEAAKERIEVQRRGADIVELLEDGQGDDYAGVWFDNEKGEFVVPVLDAAKRPLVDSIFDATGLRQDYRTVEAQFSWAELEVGQDRLDKQLLPLIEKKLVLTGLDPRTNAVSIMQASGAGEVVRERIDDVATAERVDVEVEPKAAQRFNISPKACDWGNQSCGLPLRGGVEIEPVGCTSAFKAVGKTSGDRLLLTAGHCATEWPNWSVRDTDDGNKLKTVGPTTLVDFVPNDWAAIRVNGSDWDTNPWPSQVVLWGIDEQRAITREASSFIGQFVCHSGVTTGASCGPVVELDLTLTLDGWAVVHGLTKVEGGSFCNKRGDSGGPVVAGNTALGIFSGGRGEDCPNPGYYVEVTRAADAMDLTVAPRAIPESDINADGRADLVTLTSEGTAYVYSGYTNYKFGFGVDSFNKTMDPALYDGVGHHVIDVADVNGDQRSDLITLTSEQTVCVYPGQGDKKFGKCEPSFNKTMQPGILKRGGHEPIAVADVTGDGRGDLITFFAPTGEVVTYQGHGNYTFSGQIYSFAGTMDSARWDRKGHYFLDVADVTGDGHGDLVTVTTEGYGVVYKGQENGSFVGPIVSFGGTLDTALNDGVGHEPIGVADVTADGHADLVTFFAPTGKIVTYPGRSDGGFSPGLETTVGALGSSLFDGTGHEFATLIDVSGDGHSDLVTSYSDGNALVLPGNPSGIFGAALSSFAGTFDSSRFDGVGHEIAMEKPQLRRWGCPANGCRVPEGGDTIGVTAPSIGHWCLSNRTTSGTAVCDLYQTGLGAGAKAIAGDWNGDGKATVGFLDPSIGHWCLSNRTTSGTLSCDIYLTGLGAGATPIAGDWNGDGIDTVGILDQGTGNWCLSNRTTSGSLACDLYHTGLGKGAKAIAGDWNGDSVDTVGIFDPNAGKWCLSNLTTSGTPVCDLQHTGFGGATDKAIAGDWNNDGIDSVGIYKPSTGTPVQWCLSNRITSGTPACDLTQNLGGATDEPIAGDWDGA